MVANAFEVFDVRAIVTGDQPLLDDACTALIAPPPHPPSPAPGCGASSGSTS
jgi:hypothetical protein